MSSNHAIADRNPRTRYDRLARMLVALAILTPLVALHEAGTVRAEDIVETAFEQQWRTTDAAVADGQVRRTYFWGPQPFAHTAEVYAEAPNGGQRRVQYFDKARMELTRRPGEAPDLVTNGLLTVELVTGQLQVGDTAFLLRTPATTPVAGDPVSNETTPTYATFAQGKLAFGAPGAAAATDRTGQPVREAVNKAGVVSTLTELPAPVAYARYFAETGHNIADVFYDFFLAEPLGEAAWLAVMGYPIAEPYWTREPVIVAGQPRTVLIQLFQRRVVTYTPANPEGWRVEMGNIGQHYYRWRYGVDEHDPAPGNYRLIRAQDTSLYSTSIRDPADTVKLGEAPTTITGLWVIGGSLAVLATQRGAYLADLTGPRAFTALSLPTRSDQVDVRAVSASADGRRLALLVGLPPRPASMVQVYVLGERADDAPRPLDSFTAYQTAGGLYPHPYRGQMTVARGGDHLAIPDGRALHLVDLGSRSRISLTMSETVEITRVEWIGQTTQLLVSVGGSTAYDADMPGGVFVVDASTGAKRTLLTGPGIRSATISPDGHFMAVKSSRGVETADSQAKFTGAISFRSLANPSVELTPVYEQGTPGRNSFEPTLEGWSADGSYLAVRSWASQTAGGVQTDVNLVSLATGRAIQQNGIPGNYNSYTDLRLAGPFYTLTAIHLYDGPERPSIQSLTIQNVDGSEQRILFRAQVTPNTLYNDVSVRTAQVAAVAPR